MHLTARIVFALRPPHAIQPSLDQLGDGIAVRTTPHLEHLGEMARTAPYGSVLVLPPNTNPADPHLRALRAHHPDLPLLLCVEREHDGASRRLALFRSGISEILLIPDDLDPAHLRTRIVRAVPHDITTMVDTRDAQVTGRSAQLVRAASEIGMRAGHPRDLARLLCASNATLVRWFRAARLPSPRETLLCIRILTAARMMTSPARSIEDVAHACGYSGGSPFRRAVRAVTGMSPRELRGPAALSIARSAVRRRLLDAAGNSSTTTAR